MFVPGEPPSFESSVQFAHSLIGFFIGWVFGIEARAGLAEHESKGANVLWKIANGKLDAGHWTPRKQRQIALFIGFEIVKDKVGKIRNQDKAREFVKASVVCKVFDIAPAQQNLWVNPVSGSGNLPRLW